MTGFFAALRHRNLSRCSNIRAASGRSKKLRGPLWALRSHSLRLRTFLGQIAHADDGLAGQSDVHQIALVEGQGVLSLSMELDLIEVLLC
ncbi:MAG: hypothetical protein ACI91Z_000925 [Yoonia sp.]|jgi:hypothetical protein